MWNSLYELHICATGVIGSSCTPVPSSEPRICVKSCCLSVIGVSMTRCMRIWCYGWVGGVSCAYSQVPGSSPSGQNSCMGLLFGGGALMPCCSFSRVDSGVVDSISSCRVIIKVVRHLMHWNWEKEELVRRSRVIVGHSDKCPTMHVFTLSKVYRDIFCKSCLPELAFWESSDCDVD